MYELTVDSHFDAAHCLRGYEGSCSRVHGHTWTASVTVAAEGVGEIGLSMDFRDIAARLDDEVRELDHQNLNDLPAFTDLNPTAENIARYLYDRLDARFDVPDVNVLSVTVGESERYRVTYRGHDNG
jgi:6-pyruvoyltetrahydropterin/6-carboxytetrahydropterin synthase